MYDEFEYWDLDPDYIEEDEYPNEDDIDEWEYDIDEELDDTWMRYPD